MTTTNMPFDEAINRWNLTLGQRSVLRCVWRGLSNPQIARELDIGEAAVKVNLAALFAFFGARNRTDLANRVHCVAVQTECDAQSPFPEDHSNRFYRTWAEY
jgi:DNA-binding NarL/FixJ family response regulator